MLQRTFAIIASILPADIALSQAFAPGDPKAGDRISLDCMNCHGVKGLGRAPIYPNLAGQPQPYLAAQIAAFRDGDRQIEFMITPTRNLTDQDIADVAAYYSGLSFRPAPMTNPDGGPAACVECHGADGMPTRESVPIIAGQSLDYMVKQMRDYRSGVRFNEKMNAIAEALDDTQISTAAEWYASVSVSVD